MCYRSVKADAQYEFVRCVLKDPNGGIGAGVESDLADFCASTGPATGTYDLPDGERAEILLKVTAARPGRLRIDGADITYRRSGEHLFQRGTQQVGTSTVLTVKQE